MFKKILQKNGYKFLVSLIPVAVVGIMAPLRSYIMQLLIDSSDYRELLKMCLIAVVFSVGVFVFEWISKKSQAMVVLIFAIIYTENCHSRLSSTP